MMVRKLTPDQVDEMLRLREAGKTDGQLALRFKLTQGGVNYHCLANGIAVGKLGDRGPMVRYRNGQPVRRFTPEEDRLITDLAHQDMPRAAIGRKIGRSHRSVASRLMTLARREEAAA